MFQKWTIHLMICPIPVVKFVSGVPLFSEVITKTKFRRNYFSCLVPLNEVYLVIYKTTWLSIQLCRREIIDEDGWLHTGDIGTWLPGGRLKIIDRWDSIILVIIIIHNCYDTHGFLTYHLTDWIHLCLTFNSSGRKYALFNE